MEAEQREQHRFRQSVKVWCKSGNVLVDTAALCVVLKRHVVMMSHALFVSGKRWEKRERQRELRALQQAPEPHDSQDAVWMPARKYRIPLTYDGAQEIKFLEETRRLMDHECAWAVIPSSKRTQHLQTKVTIMLCRGASLANKRLDESKNYPAKLIAIVNDPGLAKEVEADAKCGRRLDVGSRAFLDHHGGDISSTPTPRMMLVPIAVLGHDETVAVEWSHGRYHRYILRRSGQRRLLELGGLNVYWLNDGFVEAEKGWWGSPTQVIDGASLIPTRKRKKNAWNVFLEDFDGDGYIDHTDKVKAASAKWRALSRVERQVFVKKAEDLDETPAGNKRAHSSAATRASSTVAPAGVHSSLETTSQVVRYAGMPWQALERQLNTSRQERRARTTASNAEDQAEDVDMAEIETERFADIMHGLATAESTLANDTGGFVSRSHAWNATGASFQHFEASMPGLRKEAKELVEQKVEGTDSSKRHAQIHKAVMKLWQAMHSPISHQDIPDLTACGAEKPTCKTLCFQANRCLCNSRGKSWIKTYRACSLASRRAFPRGNRRAIISSEVVAMFMSYETTIEPNGRIVLTAGDDGCGEQVFWYLLSFVQQKPWELHFAEFKETGSSIVPSLKREDDAPLELQAIPGSIHLVSQHKYFTPWQFPEVIDPTRKWEVVFFEVCYTSQMVGSFRPNNIEVFIAHTAAKP